jgi:germination protein M
MRGNKEWKVQVSAWSDRHVPKWPSCMQAATRYRYLREKTNGLVYLPDKTRIHTKRKVSWRRLMQVHRRRFAMAAIVLFCLSITLLAACGGADNTPDRVRYVKDTNELSKAAKGKKYIQRQLFLENASGLLIPRPVGLPESKQPIRQALEYLVKEGPVTDLLPNGFQAVLPQDTEVKSATLDSDGHLTVNLSKDLLTAKAADRERIVQAMVWTATQFNSVKDVRITVDGKAFQVNGEPAPAPFSRADGINATFGDVSDVAGSRQQTVYYLAANKGNAYNVPVTVRVPSAGDQLSAMVGALIHEPSGSALISAFNPNADLLEKPIVKNGVAYLHFNTSVYENKAAKTISDEALRCLVLTLTGIDGIRQVAIKVGNSEKVMTESGETIGGPVSRAMIDASGL